VPLWYFDGTGAKANNFSIGQSKFKLTSSKEENFQTSMEIVEVQVTQRGQA
jgi:hypothetical protein